MQTLSLKKAVVTRVMRGHPWIYRNELPELPPDFPPGALVELVDSRGRFIAIGYCNPKSVITVRILSRERETIDEGFFRKRIGAAHRFRERFYAGEESYRVVYSEADLLPGVILDRYGDHAVVQILTAGMERHTESIVAAIREVLSPQTLIARNDVSSRALEGLKVESSILFGTYAPPVVVKKNGLHFEVDLLAGQKTGFFLDQSDNYLALQGIVEGQEVLDTFCYSGGWSLHAARFDAKSITGVDASESAIALARQNAIRNGSDARCQFYVANVFDFLKECEKERRRYDCIILDPPSFVKRRKEIENAIRGYKEINLRAMKLLRPGGFLVTCSCSYHLSPDQFRDMLVDAAGDVGRTLRQISLRSQGKDHPALLALPETEYLKCAFLQVL